MEPPPRSPSPRAYGCASRLSWGRGVSPRLEGLEMTLREVLTRAGILDAEPDSGLAPDGRATCIKCRGTLQAEVLQ
jgi:hypothetical protein